MKHSDGFWCEQCGYSTATKQIRTIKWVQHAEITPEIEQKTKNHTASLHIYAIFKCSSVRRHIGNLVWCDHKSFQPISFCHKMGIEAAIPDIKLRAHKCKYKSQQHKVWRGFSSNWHPIISQVPWLCMANSSNKADHYVGISVLLCAEQQQKTTKEENGGFCPIFCLFHVRQTHLVPAEPNFFALLPNGGVDEQFFRDVPRRRVNWKS